MSVESPTFSELTIKEARQLLVTRWSQIEGHLPENFNPHHKKFLRDYFRAQLRIAQGKRVKAGRIFAGLEKKTGFIEFEQKCGSYLAAVDIAVRGKTNLIEKPAFSLNGNGNGTSHA